jgi:hypothetical protein
MTMCKFFSLISDGNGKPYYFDYKIRKQIISGELKYETDSHSSIADYFGFKGEREDVLNKYEYNPLTKEFKVDQLNTTDDSKIIKDFCLNLDFKTIVPELIIKPIIHPIKDIKTENISKKDIFSLKEWASVRDSVVDSVWDSVRASVGDSVLDSVVASVLDSVGDSVWDSVRDSVWDSVRDSVWASVRDSVRASVRDSVWAYYSSYFKLDKWKYIDHKKGENPFQSCIDLWNKGLVPSFDGKNWRLHGYKGKELFKISKENLKKYKKEN